MLPACLALWLPARVLYSESSGRLFLTSARCIAKSSAACACRIGQCRSAQAGKLTRQQQTHMRNEQEWESCAVGRRRREPQKECRSAYAMKSLCEFRFPEPVTARPLEASTSSRSGTPKSVSLAGQGRNASFPNPEPESA